MAKDKQKKRTAYIVSHTHWDREWRYTIWDTQLMLVDFIDELIDVLESGKYPGFLLDGQVVPVLDYLEIRPEMTERVKTLISSGKLQVGPWYTLPDEYPVDGEALIRNLIWGNRKSRELGGALKVGYTSFGWGQTAQLPQIYAGFGMDVGMIGKKVNKHRAPDSEFIWQAPDGSEMLVTRFGKIGRQNFYFKVHLPALFGVAYDSPEWEYFWDKGEIAYHRADSEQMEQDHFMLNAPDKWYPESITPERIEEAWKTTDESVLEDDRLMMNGCDYAASQPMFPEMLKRIKEVDPDPDRQWIHTTMSEFAEVMKQKIDRTKLNIVKGELRDGPVAGITGNALSTRLYVKRLNKKAQNLLIRFAEPFSVVARLAGAEFPKHFIDKAWKHLLESHPHDSINGVTQDSTVEDVMGRLHTAAELSKTLANKAMQELVRRIDMDNFSDEDVLVTVFNPLPYPRHEILEAWINVPQEGLNKSDDCESDAIQIFDADGNAVGTQWEGCQETIYPVAEVHTRVFPYHTQRHKVYFDTGIMPACGYKVFRVGSIEEERTEGVAWTDGVTRTDSILKSPHVIENEFLRVEMNTNGTFNLTDKNLKKHFCNLNYYEDRGEHGCYWNNKRPMFNQSHTSSGCSARIWAEESGPLQATLVSEIAMLLPKQGIKEQNRRGDQLVELKIRTSITLKSGQKQVEVNVEFENQHEDHYLRAMFPTNIKDATHADVGGHLTVDRRPIKPQGPAADSVWPDMGTLPQNNFVDVSDGKTGVAFLNDSLTEYEVLDDDERTVALSLLRSVKNWICTGNNAQEGSDYPSQKGGKSLGCHSIRYAIRPHAGNWQEADIPLEAELFNLSAVPVQTRKHSGLLPADQASLFEISNTTLRFSALKKTEDSDTFIVRIYNPTDKPQNGSINFAAKPANAWITNLNEEREKEIALTNEHEIPVEAGPQKIVTIEIEMM